jgi:hypothetical protein
MASTDRKNALTSDGSFWTSDTITITSSILDNDDIITISDFQENPLVLHDPLTKDDYDVLQELKDTKRKLEAMETLIDKLLENARLDTSVAEALDKHEMLKRLSGDL